MRFFQIPKQPPSKAFTSASKLTPVRKKEVPKSSHKTANSSSPLLPTQPLPAHQGEAPYAGLLPFVRFVRYHLGLPLLLAHVTCKDKGYRAVSLLLILLCRPYVHSDSINPLRSLLAQRFIQRVFTLSYGKQRGASVDILYDLFEKLDPDLIEAGFYRHLQQMRRRGLIGKQLRGYLDSTILEKSPHSTFEKAAWITLREVSYYGFKLFIIIDITTKTLVYVRFTTGDQTDAKALLPAVQQLHQLGFRLTQLGFDRGFWSGENFQFLDRHQIRFFTVLKNYQKEHQDLIHQVTSRTAGRQRLKPGAYGLPKSHRFPSISISKRKKFAVLSCVKKDVYRGLLLPTIPTLLPLKLSNYTIIEIW